MLRFAFVLVSLLFTMRFALADPVDDVVLAEMKRTSTPGISLAVVKNGVIIREQGYGIANVEHQVPVRPETVFQSDDKLTVIVLGNSAMAPATEIASRVAAHYLPGLVRNTISCASGRDRPEWVGAITGIRTQAPQAGKKRQTVRWGSRGAPHTWRRPQLSHSTHADGWQSPWYLGGDKPVAINGFVAMAPIGVQATYAAGGAGRRVLCFVGSTEQLLNPCQFERFCYMMIKSGVSGPQLVFRSAPARQRNQGCTVQ